MARRRRSPGWRWRWPPPGGSQCIPGSSAKTRLINLTEARGGPISVWFTAWWIYIVKAVTLGTTAIPVLTLFNVLLLAYATRRWAAACLPARPGQDGASTLVCASPLVGALGIQLSHDAAAAAGLLLAELRLIVRTEGEAGTVGAGDLAPLAAPGS